MHLNCFAGTTKRSHEFVIKEEIKFVNISKVREQAPLFSSNFAHGQRRTRKKKLIFRSSMKFPFQRIQDQCILRPVQGDMANTLDVARSEIRRDRLQRWDEMDITLNQFWANEDSLERKIRALRNGAMFQYMFCSGN